MTSTTTAFRRGLDATVAATCWIAQVVVGGATTIFVALGMFVIRLNCVTDSPYGQYTLCGSGHWVPVGVSVAAATTLVVPAAVGTLAYRRFQDHRLAVPVVLAGITAQLVCAWIAVEIAFLAGPI